MSEEQLYNFFEKNARFRMVDNVGGVYTIEFNGKTIWDGDTGKLFDKMKELNNKGKIKDERIYKR